MLMSLFFIPSCIYFVLGSPCVTPSRPYFVSGCPCFIPESPSFVTGCTCFVPSITCFVPTIFCLKRKPWEKIILKKEQNFLKLQYFDICRKACEGMISYSHGAWNDVIQSTPQQDKHPALPSSHLKNRIRKKLHQPLGSMFFSTLASNFGKVVVYPPSKQFELPSPGNRAWQGPRRTKYK